MSALSLHGGPKPRRRNRQAERVVQKAIASYLASVLPAEIPWTHIAHGGFELPVHVAKHLKDAGLRRGFPDYLILWNRRAIFLEAKRPADLLTKAGAATKEQRNLHDLLRLQGCIVAVVEGIDDVRKILAVVGVPTREAA